MGFKITADGPIAGVPVTVHAVRDGLVPARKSRTEHVRWIPPDVLLCRHCRYTYKMNLPAPMSIAAALMKAFTKDHRGCKLRKQSGLACTYCFNFGHEPLLCPLLDYQGDPEKWWAGPDTGISSKVIFCKLHGTPARLRQEGLPRDADDFGRCHRLLHAIPGWRGRIGEMIHEPGWGPLVEAWDKLEAAYEAALHDSKDYPVFAVLLNEALRDRDSAWERIVKDDQMSP